ncbi:PREDICTED: U-box domain-containing protein 39-like isoform X2 [Camelina sativa]|uniref:RING-type E3 ubiquitin transferase n=1 Tax=Camelina sativa TaxID=90675 RepID=A0ABM0ZFP3_CAMSA|nr:PREDICTED: U-box domain-containing protein 39-like isoform X1 [Camelina sativa]XP_010515092.1 PREDICTED: U-box domain-containing protein 39-like isoform X2 [Camelina sativa]
MGETGRHKWFSFHHHRSASATSMPQQNNNPGETPTEFLCPITGFLMSDPVVVASGQTFERVSVQVCRNLGFAPKLHDGTQPDLSTVIPNLAMRSTILSYCDRNKMDHPRPPDYAYVEGVVRTRMDTVSGSGPGHRISKSEILPPLASNSNSDYDSVMGAIRSRSRNAVSSSNSLPFHQTRPVNHSTTRNPTSFSSSDYSSFPPMSPEEEEIYNKLSSVDTIDHEQGLIQLRKTTRSNESTRISLCTDRILSLLRSLIVSRYNVVQTNAAASLVNLSLEKPNKLKIVRSGFVPLLIDVLKSGSTEAQEHVIGALFSLAVEEENKMVIGVLGAVEPLLHALRSSESERARQDAALALYHLSLIPNNRNRLVKAGAVPVMLSMIRNGESASRILLLLCNIAACPEGKGAMLDGNAVAILVGKLRESGGGGVEAEVAAARENCVGALLTLSVGNMRFRGLASEVGLEEVLTEIVESESGSGRLKEKAAKILQTMRGGDREFGEGAEAREWNKMLEASGLSRSQFQQGGQKGGFAYSSQF